MFRVVWLIAIATACSSAPPARPREEAPLVPVAPDAMPDASLDAAVDAPIAIDAPRFEPTAFAVTVQGHGRPVILIPGLGCPSSVWDGVIAHFGDTVETHTLALAGFAGRPPIDGPINATVRAELASYIRDRGLDHPVVIGHSLGGFIAYWLAAAEPDLVGPVVVVDAAPQTFGDTAPATVRARAQRWLKMTDAQFTVAVGEYFGTMSRDKVKLAPVIAAVAKSDRRTFVEAFVELAAVDLRQTLGAITAPVLVIVAEGQRFRELVARQTAPIRDRKITLLPNTRHFVFFDDPTGFFRAVDEFLAAHPDGRVSP